MSPNSEDTRPETIEVTQARQGRSGARILLILLGSVAGAVLLLLLLLFLVGPRLADTTEGEAMQARTETPVQSPN